MRGKVTDYSQQLHAEIDLTPEEYQPLLLRIVHSFREGVTGSAQNREQWFINAVQEGMRASQEGRLSEHSQIREKWEVRRAAELD